MMDPVFGGLLAAAAVGGMDLFGGLLSQSTGRQIASDNRRFIRDMYKKRYQLTMKDMQKAGLNPVLAANGGNVGSVPTPGSFPSVDNILGSAANSAMSAAQSVYGMRKTDADITRSEATTKSINQDVVSKTIKNKYLEPQEEAMVKDAIARATNNTALATLNEARARHADQLAESEWTDKAHQASRSNWEAQRSAQAAVRELGDPEYWASNEERYRFWKAEKEAKILERQLRPLWQSVNSATGVMRLGY